MFKKYFTDPARLFILTFLLVMPAICMAQENDFILDNGYTDGTKNYYIVHGCNKVKINGVSYSSSGEVTVGTTDHYTYTVYKGSNSGKETVEQCDQYTWPASGLTYTESTTTPTTLKDIHGCDSIVTLTLTIKKSTYTDLNEIACDSYTWHDSTYTTSQNPTTYTTTNAVGCDSIVRLFLTINKSDTTIVPMTACDSYTWNGRTYTESTESQNTLLNTANCDSVIIFSLIIHHSISSTVNEVIRENLLPYTYHGTTFSTLRDSSGLSFSVKSVAGCDSTISYSIHFITNTRDSLDTTICQNLLQTGFRWNAKTFTEPGTNIITLQRRSTGPDTYGQYADSVVIMTVKQYDSYEFSEVVSICDDETYTYRGTTYNTQGIYAKKFQTEQGCDSNYVLHLTVHPTYAIDTTRGICNNAPITLCGITYDKAGVYNCNLKSINNCDSLVSLTLVVGDTTIGYVADTITENQKGSWSYRGLTISALDEDNNLTTRIEGGNIYGCDSIIHCHLHIYQNVYDTVDSSICANSFPLLWNTLSFSNEGERNIKLTNYYGADSMLTMRVHSIANPTRTQNDTVVENQLPVTFYGATFYNAVTNYRFTIPAPSGCDSIIIYNLVVLENKHTRIDTTVCESNLPITWRNHTFEVVGWQYDTLPGSDGTDSILAYFLTTSPLYNDTFPRSICSNQRIYFGDQYYTESDTITYETFSSFGCDSVATLVLTVNPVSSGIEYDTIVENQLNERHKTSGGYVYCYYRYEQCFNDSVSHATVFYPGGNQYQCDSIIDYSLYIRWNRDTTLYDTICGDLLPRTWHGQTFTTNNFYGEYPQGTYVKVIDTLTTYGADSTIYLSLTVHASYHIEESEVYCEDITETPFSWRDTTITDSRNRDTFYLPRTSAYGCDSIHTLFFTLASHSFDTIFDTIVENQTKSYYCYNFNGVPFCDTTTITDSLIVIANVAGCDSNISYNLFVHKNVYRRDTMVICADQLPLTWNYTRFSDQSLPVENEPGKSRSGIIQDSVAIIAHTGADSVINMTVIVHPTYHIDRYDTICDDSSITFLGQTYFETTTESRNLPSVNQCDSTWTLHLQSYESFAFDFYDTIYEDEQYFFGGYAYNKTGDYTSNLTTVNHCDSILTLHLTSLHKKAVDSTICRNNLPFTWNGVRFVAEGKKEVTLKDVLGLDSIVVMRLHVQDTSFGVDRIEHCNAYTWRNGVRYTESSYSNSIRLTNSNGCDSVIYLSLTIYYDQEVIQQQQSCDNYTWINGRTYDTSIYGPQKMLKTVHGCDSLVTLDLHIDYSVYEEECDSICEGQVYVFRGRSLTKTSTNYDSLVTDQGCDSISVLYLTVLGRPSIDMSVETDCENGTHALTVESSVGFTYWTSLPHDPTLESQKTNRTIVVSPQQNTAYILHSDYASHDICPATDTIVLKKIYQPVAKLKTSPDYLSYDNMEVTAVDLSENSPSRNWYVNDTYISTISDIMRYTADAANDTVYITLEIYNDYCRDTAYAAIQVLKPNVYVPNAFTPGQQHNNRFYAIATDINHFEMYIYDRRGILLFHSNDITNGWDGTANGELCPQGSYAYIIRYQAADIQNSEQVMVGSLLLIR